MATLRELRESTSAHTLPAFAWPAGFPMFYLTKDGGTICPKCANESATSDPVAAGEIHWEDAALTCDDCGNPIPSAYGE